MNKGLIIGVVIGALVVGGGSFYAGMQYAGQSRSARFANGAGFTGGAGRTGPRGGAGGGFTAGTIVAKDATSVTIQLGGPNATSTNGSATGSKIVLYNGSTQIGKFTTGTTNDLAVGEMVTVTGTPNTDGSVTATTIQVRPAGMGGPRGQ